MKKMNKAILFFITDADGKKSLTRLMFTVGFLVVNAKLLLSGVEVGGINMAPFSGVEYAAAITALGGVYVLRRSTNKEGNH